MKESNFQFKRPFLIDLHFGFNTDFNPDADFSLSQEFSTNVMMADDDKSAVVELDLVIGAKENTPFDVKITMASEFQWDSSITDIDDFLSINSATLLLSYMRPIVATVTSSSPLPGYQIPFMDFTKKD